MERSNREFGTIFKKCVRRLADHKDKKVGTIDEELAERFGYTRQTIGHWKTGYSVPEPDIIETLAKIFISAGENDRQLLNRFLLRGLYGSSQEITEFLDEQLGIKRGVIPDAMQTLIDEKTAKFVGRDYVFEAIEQFLNNNHNGYFIIEGDPGMGKTTILAEYVKRTNCIAFFNDRLSGPTGTAKFLKTVQKQLIERFNLDEQPSDEGTFLRELLYKLAPQLDKQKVVIAVDALDEVDLTRHPTGTNVLYLPDRLPDNIYFVVTRRRMDKENYTLYTPGAQQEAFDLLAYHSKSLEDVQQYIRQELQDQKLGPKLHRWINKYVKPPEPDADKVDYFVVSLADKSENNFMYLYWILLDLAEEKFTDFEGIPTGLQEYYERHWVLMKNKSGDDKWHNVKIPLIATLVAERKPVSIDLLIRHSRVTQKGEILSLLQEWTQFIPEIPILDDDGEIQNRYRVYHYSFNDFVASEPKVKERIKEQRQRIIHAGLDFLGIDIK